MKPFCDELLNRLLLSRGLSSFDALWDLQLETVDAPNCERGGWSSVCRLELTTNDDDTQAFYIKRQSNHLSRSVQRPLGEPTFAREYRNILAYEQAGIGALEAVYYQERKQGTEMQAILITKALDDYRPLSDFVSKWSELDEQAKSECLKVTAELIGRLHGARLTHHCLYPKHVYINHTLSPKAVFIDLEKTRYQWLKKRDCVADISALLRRWNGMTTGEMKAFLISYLSINDIGIHADELLNRFYLRKKDKEARP